MAVPIDTALQYLGIDEADELITANVQRCLATAERIFHGAVGDVAGTPLEQDSRVDELTLIYLEDLYSQRGLPAKVSGATRRLVQSMELQLRLELARGTEAGV